MRTVLTKSEKKMIVLVSAPVVPKITILLHVTLL